MYNLLFNRIHSSSQKLAPYRGVQGEVSVSAKISALSFITVLCLVSLLQGCSSKPSRKEEQAANKPGTTVEKSATVNDVHFFLETSASMGGYLKGGTEFKDIVSEIVTKANQIKPVTVYTIAGKPQSYTGDVNSFVTSLATTPLATGRSSELHNIFKEVGDKAKGNSIAILVSDCILSFPDADIKRNVEINRTDASSVLKNAIYDQFASLSKQGIGATVYAFRSAFNGTYYTYQNQKQPLVGESRPFYVWVIGKQGLLATFNQQLQEMLTTKPARQLDFGAGSGFKKYDLLFSLNKKGDWRAERGNVTEIKSGRKSEPVEFAIAMDLSTLPSYAQTESYLKQNLAIKAENATLKLVSVKRRENVNTTQRLSDREMKLLTANSHVLTFRVESQFDEEATVGLRLPVRFDTWYSDWSTMDDRKLDERRNKTFALEHLMNGVREAYQSSGNDFVTVSFKLIKD